MNAIIYKHTVQVSLSLSLLRLFTRALILDMCGGAVTRLVQSSAGLLPLPVATPLFRLSSHPPNHCPAVASGLPFK